MERQRAASHRSEARGKDFGNEFVAVSVENQPNHAGALRGGGAEQARRHQGPNVVGSLPGHRTVRVMDRLEVHPIRGVGIEIDDDVVGHRITVCELQAVEVGERDHRQLDGRVAERGRQLRIVQQRRQRSSGDEGKGERAIAVDPKRRTTQAPAEQALARFPISLGENPHARVQDPHQRTTQPDQKRRVEDAPLSDQQAAVRDDDSGRGIARRMQQPSERTAQEKVAAVCQPSHRGAHHRLPASWRMRSLSEVRAQGNSTTETHFRNVRAYPNGCSSIRRLEVRAVTLRS